MPDWVQPFLVYGGIVVFWSIIFIVAVTMTRRSLRGVGDPVPDPDESETASTPSANASATSPTTESAGKAAGGAH